MNHLALTYQLRGFACMARIEGMKVENDVRFSQGLAPAYTEDDFFYEAEQLEQLSSLIANDGWQQQ